MSTTTQEREAPVIAEPVYPEYAEAARLIRVMGWSRTGEDTGKVCVMQAAWLAAGRVGVLERCGQLSKGLGFNSDDETFLWNDHPNRTLSEVLERLERAAYGL